MSNVLCFFWDPTANEGRGPNGSKCEHDAATFVRVKQSGRLCPLCKPCFGTFETAQANLKEKTGPEATYEVVELEAGRDEYAKQPPKK